VSCLAAGLLVAVPAGWLWIRLADPPAPTLERDRIDLGELTLDHISAITLWFFVVGLVAGLSLGVVAGLLGRRHGVVTVVAVVLMCTAAALTSAWCGEHWFGPDDPVDFVALLTGDETQLEGRQVGDQLASDVSLATGMAYLGWPVGGMIGVLGAVAGWPRNRQNPRRGPVLG